MAPPFQLRLLSVAFVSASCLALFAITLSQSKLLLTDLELNQIALGTPSRVATTPDSRSTIGASAVNATPAHSKYAYAFVIGGCNPAEPSYRGYIYNILVATRLLRETGAKQDVVALFQLSSKSPETVLPPEDLKPLEALGVKIKYLSKENVEDFYGIQMRKFDILNLTEYRRVIHMDGDVMPVTNLDYLFELSDGPNATLKENLVVSGVNEPANGGFFMLAPGVGRLEELREIVRKRDVGPMDEENLLYGGKIQFDTVKGWGHTIEPPDAWVTRRQRGNKWNFHAAFVDQGLLYHYVKYHRKSVSIVFGKGTVENWGTGADGKVLKESYLANVLTKHSKPLVYDKWSCLKWMCDFVHFVSRSKPWTSKKGPVLTGNKLGGALDLWWSTFRDLNQELSLGVDLANWTSFGKPPLGYTSNPSQLRIRLEKAKRDEIRQKPRSSGERTKPNTTVIRLPSKSTHSTPVSAALGANRTSQAFGMNETSKYAYAFVIGGCDPDHPSYRGYVYNILVTAHLLKQFGSMQDVVALFQLSSKTNHTQLAEQDVRWLNASGVKIRYLSKSTRPEGEDFYELQMRKFDILNLTEYRRVLHMDGDVMPLGNMDYLFELSDGPDAVLKENIVVTGQQEPSNGGFFILAPGPGRLDQLNDVIRRRKETDPKNISDIPPENRVKGGNALFDSLKGWGHVIEAPDQWVTRYSRGRKWTFHAAFADQGLLYHYVKYVRKTVSFIFGGGTVVNSGQDVNGTVRQEGRFEKLLARYSHPVLHDKKACNKFMCDFVHFTGSGKPWNGRPVLGSGGMNKKSALTLWWSTLQRVDSELSMGLNFANWVKPGRPPLGIYPKRVG